MILNNLKSMVLTLLALSSSLVFGQAVRWQSFEYKDYPWLDSNMNVFQAHDKAILRPLFIKLNILIIISLFKQ
jgi:hypothetical protein